jgi:hypothetical protein
MFCAKWGRAALFEDAGLKIAERWCLKSTARVNRPDIFKQYYLVCRQESILAPSNPTDEARAGGITLKQPLNLRRSEDLHACHSGLIGISLNFNRRLHWLILIAGLAVGGFLSVCSSHVPDIFGWLRGRGSSSVSSGT